MSHLRVLIFVACMSGNIMFISYKASLTSLLTLDAEAMPFAYWASFMKTDFKLIFHRFVKIDFENLKNIPEANKVLEERTGKGKTFYGLVSSKRVLLK
jgi:hypothetical protein